ncbi:hypothetical protein VT84_09175 [Gemmata sp. SH-PL17]|uniref:hypothetical protein n=1 Tax=Gemmata sp. SH-PL17 TaxID=1630693 RepID=UPI00078D6C13|nr:hypothetical protein [Gemmata sp. SH-PL17]AMV24554.1 hypothetical protein VT84_09175 [Gemmata sp. SH-PL17]
MTELLQAALLAGQSAVLIVFARKVRACRRDRRRAAAAARESAVEAGRATHAAGLAIEGAKRADECATVADRACRRIGRNVSAALDVFEAPAVLPFPAPPAGPGLKLFDPSAAGGDERHAYTGGE